MTADDFSKLPDGTLLFVDGGELVEKAEQCVRYLDHGALQLANCCETLRPLGQEQLKSLRDKAEYAMLLQGHGTRV